MMLSFIIVVVNEPLDSVQVGQITTQFQAMQYPRRSMSRAGSADSLLSIPTHDGERTRGILAVRSLTCLFTVFLSVKTLIPIQNVIVFEIFFQFRNNLIVKHTIFG